LVKEKCSLTTDLGRFVNTIECDVTDHYMVTCILHTAVICHAVARYRLGRTILPSIINHFSNSLSDLTQLLPEPKQTDELDELTSTMTSILSRTLDIVAPIRLKKVREKIIAPWYNNTTHVLKRETRNLEHKWKKIIII